MKPEDLALAMAVGTFVGMVFSMELGFRWGRRQAEAAGGAWEVDRSLAGIHSALASLMAFMLGFAYSGAQGRLETRRQQIVDEVNVIADNYQYLDILPKEDQPNLRELYRRYVDARIAAYADVSDLDRVREAWFRSEEISNRIWTATVASASKSPKIPVMTLTLGKNNDLTDITVARWVALNARTPVRIMLLIWFLGPITAFASGLTMAERAKRHWPHFLLYCAAVAFSFHVVLDLDSPRFGRVRLTEEQSLMERLRASMK